jgi:hypothetical protein
MRKLPLLAASAIASTAAFATPAHAATQIGGAIAGNVCGGAGGINNCTATQTGVTQGTTTDPLASSLIARIDFNDNGTISTREISSLFGTITGSEFTGSVDSNNILTFTYTPGTGDPAIHYFGLSQANTYDLFYDPNAITSLSINLTTYFANNPGLSHLDVFDTTVRSVPEPATWAMMMIGFGAIGFSMRRRSKGRLQQLA